MNSDGKGDENGDSVRMVQKMDGNGNGEEMVVRLWNYYNDRNLIIVSF